MSTLKKNIATPVQVSVDPVAVAPVAVAPDPVASAPVRFSVGAAEIAAADAYVASETECTRSMLAVYNLIFGAVDAGGHGVPLTALRALTKDERRDNYESAAYDFSLRFFAVIYSGAETAALLFDANVKGDVKVRRAGLKSTGVPYTEKTKRDFKTEMQGKDFRAWIKRMSDIAGLADIDAKVSAGEMTQEAADAATKRGAASTSTDLQRAATKGSEYVKLLQKDIDKRDGSLDHNIAMKVAKAISDLLSANGIK